uniref:condensation domain-containing protein n=1 Tax=Paenibacillus polymyxa TaxID=1406 RepID=UPI00215CC07E|nr:condensation domain-containing protein [Paenibacillus polymyxa]
MERTGHPTAAAESHRAYHTEVNDLLLTALGSALYNWSGQERVLVNLEGHGREAIVPDIDITRTVGGLRVSIRYSSMWMESRSRAAHQTGKRGPAACTA